MITHTTYLRALTSLESDILEYIKQHPGLNAEDVANEFNNTEEVYYAIAYLVVNLYVDRDQKNHAMYAREQP